jgi:hypothetical protein
MKKLTRVALGIVLLVKLVNAVARAEEPVSVSGILEAAPAGQFFASYFLRDSETGGIVAGLRDPENLLAGAQGSVNLQTDLLDVTEVNGFQLLRVVARLPEYWAQPSIWTTRLHLPGNFSSYPRGPKPKDYAGIPFTISRAYLADNGFENVRLEIRNETTPPKPFRLDQLLFGRSGPFGVFEAFAGLTYELKFASSPDLAPETVNSVEATADGTLSILAPPPRSGNGFYFLKVSSVTLP